jgi:hypothetical protein
MHLVSFANVLLLGENKTDYNKLLGSLTTGGERSANVQEAFKCNEIETKRG